SLAIDRRPYAVGAARRELACVTIVVEALDETIDPPEAERFVQCIQVSNARLPGMAFVKDQPHLGLTVVMRAEPIPPLLQRSALERLHDQSIDVGSLALTTDASNGDSGHGCNRAVSSVFRSSHLSAAVTETVERTQSW